MDIKQLQYLVVSIDNGSFKEGVRALIYNAAAYQQNDQISGGRAWHAASQAKRKRCGSYRRGTQGIRICLQDSGRFRQDPACA